MDSVINFALIGCGRIAGHNSRAILATDGLALVAVCDLELEKAKTYANEFQVPAYQNYRHMLSQHPEIDVAVIATPSGMHFEHAMEMLDYSKSVVIEKPTFMRPSQLNQAYDKASALGLNIFPIFQNRYNKAVQRTKKAIVGGELGDIRLMNVRVRWCRPQGYYDLSPWRGTYAQDGGALTNQGIHHLDLLRFLGGELKDVKAVMRTLGADIEVEDAVVASFSYYGDAIGSLEVTTAARPDDFEASISIVGSKGLAQIGGIAVNELQIFTPDPSACEKYSEDFSDCVYGHGHLALYAAVKASLTENKPYLIQRSDCTQTIHLLHAFYSSDEKGCTINLADRLESSRLGQTDEGLAKLYRTTVEKISRP